MTPSSLEKDVRHALAQLMHPEINRSLVDLGMIKDVAVNDKKVSLTLVLPLIGVPIKDELMRIVYETAMRVDDVEKVEVKLAEMNQEERAAFMKTAQEWWRF